MGFVLVVSLPFIFLSILLGFGCYFLGKHMGREEMRTEINGGDRVEQQWDYGTNFGKEKEEDNREQSRPADGSTFLTQQFRRLL
ncbi:hypothetical protein ZEAMMB73_Zm00001d034333 [Zea mays]|uniref:Uncharacterized protein n=1 Tax=Zea mays TaxID=4577 RepID=A0A1D6L6P3_MAIZE|nr:hypothetical protein ZEAMMB73_Zm00001d034333 [Zea mays]